MNKRRFWTIAAIVVVTLIAALSVLLSNAAERMRPRLVKALEDRFNSSVELGSLNISLFPSVSASAEDIALHHQRRTDVPPLIRIKRVTAKTNLFSLLAGHIRHLRLEELQITVAPRKEDEQSGAPETKGKSGNPSSFVANAVADEVAADGTTLTILSKKPGGEPMVFDIYRLNLRGASLNQPMPFQATLRNAKPPGMIQSEGKFGPWDRDDPGLTAVSGKYEFRDADLSVFRGIAGKLSSDGRYDGRLNRIEVQGSTSTPDFTVRISGHPMPLTTTFHAVVDGTDGDTLLQPVEAKILNSTILASGGVTGTPGKKGKTVALDVKVSGGRLEDLLRLAVKSTPPPMQGAITFQTKFELPPGDRDVAEKLKLDGHFNVQSGRFTSLDVRRKVEALSRRGRGKPEEAPGSAGSVLSNLKGTFRLSDGIIRFSGLSFAVPGAGVHLDGSYTLTSQALDFRGTLELEAKVSETTTGIKSVLLKAVDPFFSRGGKGAVIPIRISGTQQDPSFGLNLGGGSKR